MLRRGRRSVAGDGTLWVQGPELTPTTVVDAWFIPDTLGVIRDSAAQPLTVWQGGFTLALKPGKAFRSEDGLSGILTVRDRSGLETDVTLRAAPGVMPPPRSPLLRLQRVLGLAFLGGLILNLMPCVFPVLAMKVVGLAGTPRGRARLHAAAYTAGVLVAFAVVGAALLAARTAGAAAGWGFQFQSPAFVAGMTWLLFAVGLNLSGVFQIGTGLVGAGQGLTRHSGAAGQLLHRAAGGGGGDAMHSAVHGGCHRRWPCGPAGGDDDGVPRDGPGPGDAVCRAGCRAWAWTNARRSQGAGWRSCGRRWHSRCMPRVPGWSG